MTQPEPPFANRAVAAAFDTFAEQDRSALLAIRRLIFETAAEVPEVGPLDETLKWGQPSYLTAKTKSGSTIRIGTPKTGGVALFTHCQTSLMSDFRDVVGDGFTFDGNRALHLDPSHLLPEDALRLLIRSALTYHLNKGRA
ncbi:MAG: DUF1801 domain-containing protein [Aliishimia sp.]